MQAAHDVVALAGFHIKRQEFEPEYDNEAEMIVADMEFKEDDTEVSQLPSAHVAFVSYRRYHVLLSFSLTALLPCTNNSEVYMISCCAVGACHFGLRGLLCELFTTWDLL